MNKYLVYPVISAFLTTFLIFGCFGEEESNQQVSGSTDEVASVTISATDGGVLATESGSVSLDFPAGALAKDAEITIATLDNKDQPDAANLASFVFDLGPDGLTFEKPVKLELKLADEVPEGKKAHVATLVDGAWKTIDGSKFSGGMVSAEINHFSYYVIILLDDGSIGVTTEGGYCDDMDFTACGGDVVGKWLIKDLCVTAIIDVDGDNEGGWYTDFPGCEDTAVGVSVEYSGYMEFMEDGTQTTQMTVDAPKYDMIFDDDCLVTLGNDPELEAPITDPEEVCTMMGEAVNSDGNSSFGDCSYANGKCICSAGTGGEAEVGEANSRFYLVDGTNLLSGATAGEWEDPVPFCIEDDVLTIQVFISGNDDAPDYFVLEKE